MAERILDTHIFTHMHGHIGRRRVGAARYNQGRDVSLPHTHIYTHTRIHPHIHTYTHIHSHTHTYSRTGRRQVGAARYGQGRV